MSERVIRLSDELAFPRAVTETFGILAVRGAGKSNTAAVMAEEMFECGLPFVVIDPVGAWWGLRANGTKRGLPIPIFGGKHGDVPLEKGGGKIIADLVVEQRLSCVIDLTGFDSEASKKAFLLDFAKTLYTRNEEPLHLFLEEADDYIPQRPMRDEAHLLRAFENIVRRGRSRGLGLTLITQRSASINKNVLTQVGTLIAMRTTGPQDRSAIEEWVKFHDCKRDLLESLPSLEKGEAWVWSPEFLKETKRIRVRLRSTYDSGATPKMLKGSKPAATLADVDLGKVKELMASTIEKAKESDPRELKARIRDLEKKLAQPNVGADVEKLEKQVKDMREASEIRDHVIREASVVANDMAKVLIDMSSYAQRLAAILHLETFVEIEPVAISPNISRQINDIDQQDRKKAAQIAPKTEHAISSDITGPQQRVLDAVAWWNYAGFASPSKLQVAFVAGYKPGTGAFNNICGQLRSSGRIVYPEAGTMSLTDDGNAYAEVPQGAISLSGFHDFVRSKLTNPQCKVLNPLVTIYPGSLTKAELANSAGYTAGTGAFNNLCGQLRSLGLIDYPSAGLVRACDVLFPEGL